MPRSSGSNDQLTLRFQSDGLSCADSVGRIKAALNDVVGADVVLIPLVVGALYPFFGPLLLPTLVAVAMALSSVFVSSNALHLRFIKPVIEVQK